MRSSRVVRTRSGATMRDKSASKVGDKVIDLEHGQMQADGQQDRMGLTAKNARSREGIAAKRHRRKNLAADDSDCSKGINRKAAQQVGTVRYYRPVCFPGAGLKTGSWRRGSGKDC